jgi:hypothetical protein
MASFPIAQPQEPNSLRKVWLFDVSGTDLFQTIKTDTYIKVE